MVILIAYRSAPVPGRSGGRMSVAALLLTLWAASCSTTTAKKQFRPDGDLLPGGGVPWSSEHPNEEPQPAALAADPLAAGIAARDVIGSIDIREWSWTSYHSHEETVAFLQRLAEGSGGRCRVEQLGASVQGRELVAIVYEEPAGNKTQPGRGQQRSGGAKTQLGEDHHQQRQAGGQDAETELQGAVLPGPRRARAAARRLLQQESGPEGADLPKPNFVWIGNMHGDETANRELLLRLAAAMCSGELAAAAGAGASGTGAGAGAGVGAAEAGRWSALLGSTVVRIVPSMNPDGYSANPKTRYNANGVDLNRNFWDDSFPYGKPTPEQVEEAAPMGQLLDAWASWAQTGGRPLQPEARAVASYLSATRPELSANLHGGALVANYLLDACDGLGLSRSCPSADEPLPELQARAYAHACAAMRHSEGDAIAQQGAFQDGVTRGATWYPVLGSMQDWTYHALGRLQLTLELHEDKEPPAASLPGLWGDNRGAMLRLMELSHMGLRAVVRDADTGRTLAANVSVTQPEGVRSTTADADGYIFKPMAPGVSYSFVVQPYDPLRLGVEYDAIEVVDAKLPVSRQRYARGRGLEGLTLKRTFLAQKAKR